MSKEEIKVACLTAALGPEAGGLYYSVPALSRAVSAARDVGVRVFSMGSVTSEIESHWNSLELEVFPVRSPASYRFAPSLVRALGDYRPAILHIHGLWTYHSLAATQIQKQYQTPMMVSPRGMLDPWALQRSRWKKRILWSFIEKRFLQRCGCIHALCLSEARAIRKAGLTQPIAVIPNGVDVPQDEDLDSPEMNRKERRVLFLGRIHPKKGIASLIEGWARFLDSNPELQEHWKLIIAGWDDGGHLASYRRLAENTGFAHTITWLGATYGGAKVDLIRSADWFILPSLSEGLPMAVLEAWSYGLPTLMTEECNLPIGFAEAISIKIESSAHSIASQLEVISQIPESQRREMGAKARRLVEEDFTWRTQGERLGEVYRWMVDGGTQPEHVITGAVKSDE